MSIQRLIRSEVEPAPTPPTSALTNTCATAVNVPCPPFVTGEHGDLLDDLLRQHRRDNNGPAKIVMSEATPNKCANCKFYSSVFTVTQFPACPSYPRASLDRR